MWTGVSAAMGLPPSCSAERGTFTIVLGSTTTAISLADEPSRIVAGMDDDGRSRLPRVARTGSHLCDAVELTFAEKTMRGGQYDLRADQGSGTRIVDGE